MHKHQNYLMWTEVCKAPKSVLIVFPIFDNSSYQLTLDIFSINIKGSGDFLFEKFNSIHDSTIGEGMLI
jgi:hypothetical protein